MNDQLQAEITTILAQIATGVSKAADYSLKELPDIAQQYVTYGIWSSGFYTAISGIALIVCISVLIWAIKKIARSQYSDDNFWLVLPGALSFFFGILSFTAFFGNVHSLILVLTAPKVWFILELKNLIS